MNLINYSHLPTAAGDSQPGIRPWRRRYGHKPGGRRSEVDAAERCGIRRLDEWARRLEAGLIGLVVACGTFAWVNNSPAELKFLVHAVASILPS